MINLSSNLRQLMQREGLTSSELARKTGVSQPVIYRIMNGDTNNPQVLTIKPIADFFKITIDQLLGFTPLTESSPLNAITLHDIYNKLSTIRTIGSALKNILPGLAFGYQKAIDNNIIKGEVPVEIIPLLELNSDNLVKSADQIQQLLNNDKAKKE